MQDNISKREVNSLEGLEDAKPIEPVQISGIASGVTTTKSITHKLFGEYLCAPECRLSLILHQTLAERFSIFYVSEVGDILTLTPKDPSSNLPAMMCAPRSYRLSHLCYDLAMALGASFRHFKWGKRLTLAHPRLRVPAWRLTEVSRSPTSCQDADSWHRPNTQAPTSRGAEWCGGTLTRCRRQSSLALICCG